MLATFRSSFAVLLFLLASASLAQSPPPAGPPHQMDGNATWPEKTADAPPAPGAASGPAPVSAHEEVAREIVKLFRGEDIATAGTAEAMVAMFVQDAEVAPYKDVLREWYRKVLADSDLETEMAKIYMDTFSEKELREIAAFYKTPVGRKVIATMPELMKKSAEIGMRQAEAHAAELRKIFEKAQEESEKRPAATDGAAQKRTISEIRNTGTALFSWLTDQVGAAAAGQSQMERESPPVDLRQYDLISHEELVKILVPTYIQTIPETDGWGHPYEYYLAVENPLAPQVMAIRSPGRDGKFSALDYAVGAFEPNDLDEDIVWVDGFFVRWPQTNQPDGK